MIGQSPEGLETNHHLQIYPLDLGEAKQQTRAAESPGPEQRHPLPLSPARPSSQSHLAKLPPNSLSVEDALESAWPGFLQGRLLRRGKREGWETRTLGTTLLFILVARPQSQWLCIGRPLSRSHVPLQIPLILPNLINWEDWGGSSGSYRTNTAKHHTKKG